MLIQEQLSLVSSYSGQIVRQMEVLGNAYTDSETFIANLNTLGILCSTLSGEIIKELKCLNKTIDK